MIDIEIVMSFVEDKKSESKESPSLKILVADDDLLNRRLMQVLLTREGHQVDTVSNGMEAFDAVKFQNFDVVLMDLQMPILDGVEASRRIRDWENDGRHTYIVALTASYLPEEGQRLFEAGIDNYISKPFQLEHIQRLLKYATHSVSTSSSDREISPPEASPAENQDVQNEEHIPVGKDGPLPAPAS